MAGIFDYFRGPNPARRRGIFGGDTGIGSGDSGEATALALLNAMGPMQQAGLERSASPAGAIAKNLIPLFGAIIQGKLMEQQAAQRQELLGLEKQKLQAETAKALKGDEPKTAFQAIYERMKEKKPYQDIISAEQAMQKPTQPSEMSIFLGKEAGDPIATKLYNDLQAQKDAQAQRNADMFIYRSEQVKSAKDAADLRKIQQTPASENPRYSNKGIFEADTGKQVNPASGLIDMPGSPYVALEKNDARSVRGAKQLKQQIDELEALIPDVLPKSRLGIANTLSESIGGGKASGKIAQLQRLSNFEQMVGIKDFIAGRGPNTAEIHNIGSINPYWDTQDTAMGKVNAMRSLMAKALNSYQLNGDAIIGGGPSSTKPQAPGGTGFAGEIPQEKQAEFEAMMKGLADRHASQAEAEEAARRYIEANKVR